LKALVAVARKRCVGGVDGCHPEYDPYVHDGGEKGRWEMQYSWVHHHSYLVVGTSEFDQIGMRYYFIRILRK